VSGLGRLQEKSGGEEQSDQHGRRQLNEVEAAAAPLYMSPLSKHSKHTNKQNLPLLFSGAQCL